MLDFDFKSSYLVTYSFIYDQIWQFAVKFRKQFLISLLLFHVMFDLETDFWTGIDFD